MPQVAEVREGIVRGRNWPEVAAKQLATVFAAGDAQDQDIKRLANIYTNDWVDEVAGNPKCGQCGKEASKRCGRCSIEWYCTRDYQVNAWKAHKPICDVVSANKVSPSS